MALTTSEQEATLRINDCGPLGSDELPELTERQRRKALEPREETVPNCMDDKAPEGIRS